MECNFNMDYILGNSNSGDRNQTKDSVNSEVNSNFDINEDRMLPDSSVSPSNANESNTFDNTENTENDTDVKVIVRDDFGNKFYACAKHLCNVDDSKLNFYENMSGKWPPNKYKNVETSDATTETDLVKEEPQIVYNENYSKLFEASSIAHLETRLDEIEKSLNRYTDIPLATFINSAQNLEFIHFEDFHITSQQINRYNNGEVYEESEKKDTIRKSRMRDIYERFSEINRWLKTNKRKLNQLEKQCQQQQCTTDFSSLSGSNLPLPQFIFNEALQSTLNLTTPPVVLDIDDSHKSPFSHNSVYNFKSSDLNSIIEDDDFSTSKSPASLKDTHHLWSYADAIRDDNANFIPMNFDELKNITFHGSDLPELTYEKEEICRTNNKKRSKESEIDHNNKVKSKTQKNDCQQSYSPNQKWKRKRILSSPSTRVSSTSSSASSESEWRDSQNQHDGPSSPPTPDLRRAELDCNDISDGIRVLLLQRNYLRAGTILTSPEDQEHPLDKEERYWAVRLDGERRRGQDFILPEWQLLEQGVREVVPTSPHQLCPGTRVCASWSQQLPLNLYPGTISSTKTEIDVNIGIDAVSGAEINNEIIDSNSIPIEFDDGDNKEVDLSQVRLLPECFPNLHELMTSSGIVAESGLFSDRDLLFCTRRVRKYSATSSKICNKLAEHLTKNAASEFSNKNENELKERKSKRKMKVEWTLVKSESQLQFNFSTPTKPTVLIRNVDGVSIQAGDDVQLLNYSKSIYIAKVVKVLAKKQSNVMNLQMNWYYNLSDFNCSSKVFRKMKKCKLSKHLLFKTNHIDVNDVYSVVRKITIVPFEQFQNDYITNASKKELSPYTYILAGSYNQNTKNIEDVEQCLEAYICANVN